MIIILTLEEIGEKIKLCGRCDLCNTRINTVAGSGAQDAEVMFVGEGPGKNEDEQGLPFVGASGEFFDECLNHIGLTRDKIFLTNVVKCRPPFNRDPSEEESQQCLPYLRMQFLALRPKIIVCLGRIAALQLIRPCYKITREHGTWIEKKGIWFTATYHPSAVLRDQSKKNAAYSDYEKISVKAKEICSRVY